MKDRKHQFRLMSASQVKVVVHIMCQWIQSKVDSNFCFGRSNYCYEMRAIGAFGGPRTGPQTGPIDTFRGTQSVIYAFCHELG